MNILIKNERRLIVHRQSSNSTVFCDQCSEQMLPAQTSADFFGVSSREVYRLIESRQIHFIETAANEIYVCPESIKKVLNLIR